MLKLIQLTTKWLITPAPFLFLMSKSGLDISHSYSSDGGCCNFFMFSRSVNAHLLMVIGFKRGWVERAQPCLYSGTNGDWDWQKVAAESSLLNEENNSLDKGQPVTIVNNFRSIETFLCQHWFGRPSWTLWFLDDILLQLFRGHCSS